MLFGRTPDVPVGPEREGAEFFNCRVRGFHRVADREFARIEDSDIAAKTVEDTGSLEGHEFGIGAGIHVK